MEIRVARPAGTCYGVERALRLARDASLQYGDESVHSLGALIHNPQAVEGLQRSGVEVAHDLEDIDAGTVIIRSHGVAPAVIDAAQARGLRVVDATCPHVSRVQDAARELAEEGFLVIIVGETDHPEIRGILAYAGTGALVVSQPEDLPDNLDTTRVGIVVQTTQTHDALDEIVAALRGKVAELRVVDTICAATSRRQQAALALARDVEVMIIVGGHNSGNTRRLFELSLEVNPHAYQVETAAELEPAWFAGAATVGVSAGASTPEEQLQSVVSRIQEMPA
jgi:4-hydroxy-3-methylbut-2-enyl diphosphate reductase